MFLFSFPSFFLKTTFLWQGLKKGWDMFSLLLEKQTHCAPPASPFWFISLPFLPGLREGMKEMMLRLTSLNIGVSHPSWAVSRILSPHPQALARTPHPLKHASLNVAKPPGHALYHSGGISFECNPVSQIPTFQEATLFPMEHSVAVHCEPVLFCSFH